MPGKIVISHPSVAPFVQQAARALFEADLLDHFYTTLIDRPNSRTQKFLVKSARVFGRDLHNRLSRRRITEIPESLVTAWPSGEILRLAGSSFDRSGRLTDYLWERGENKFAAKVSRALTRNLSGIYGYEFSSRKAFERARKIGLKIFYDVPAPEPRFVEDLLADEMARFPELASDYSRHVARHEERRTAHRRREWNLADVVIAASRFTRSSFAAAGLDVSKIRIVPYGAPPVAERGEALRLPNKNSKLRLVWAGTFSIRKGAHYLLEAWRAYQLHRYATLEVFGSVTLPQHYNRADAGITYHGAISRTDLLSHFRQSDALVFPTLCDGFGMVVTEAWSQGLPVITTERAGAADLLRPGENGLIVPAADSKALGELLEQLSTNLPRLAAMRESALKTAASWQWSDYRKELARVISDELNNSQKER